VEAASGKRRGTAQGRGRDMPLSEDEQRILQEIEDNLSATDPQLVQHVSDETVHRHSGRVIKWLIAGFLVGLPIMVFPFTSNRLLRTRSVTSSRCGWPRPCSTPAFPWPGSDEPSASSSASVTTSPPLRS